MTIFGYKLHLLVTMNGLILDFELAPASAADLHIGLELLSEHADLEVIGDKAYISAAKTDDLWQTDRIRLRTLPRSNQKNRSHSHSSGSTILYAKSLKPSMDN